MRDERTVLVVMARYPEVGVVKTRLAAAVGAERACALYRAFLSDIAARFSGRRRLLVWAFHPPGRNFAALVAPGACCLPQLGRDLGERMHGCFRALCPHFASVVMIGADVPHVRDQWLDEAEGELQRADVVIGPSADGGYYLLAMRLAHDLFSGIAMSGRDVLRQTLAKAARAGLRVHLLPPSFDVDEHEDLLRLRQLLASGDAAHLPHTAAALADCGL